jgi:hypothetical protein
MCHGYAIIYLVRKNGKGESIMKLQFTLHGRKISKDNLIKKFGIEQVINVLDELNYKIDFERRYTNEITEVNHYKYINGMKVAVQANLA